MEKHLNVHAADSASVAHIRDSLGIPELVARVLVGRGISDVEQARLFLQPDIERDWNDPLLIPGMEQAVPVLADAIESHERIMVFGDFDVDGISSTAVLVKGFTALGAADVATLIPRREDEGYGLTDAALERVFADKPDVLVTVDCGITAACEVDRLIEAGISVVVTDHHEPGEGVPHDVPVVDPKLDAGCPSFDLAGAGVALKLVCALGARLGMPDLWRSLADLAMLGTISDRMKLEGENRALVVCGLKLLNDSPRPGIAAALALIPHATLPVTAVALSFGLIPRLNAAGRMLDAQIALDLLLVDDPVRGGLLAAKLEQVNDERRATEAELAEEALAQAQRVVNAHEEAGTPLRCLVLADEGWHEGVKGIVASRVASRYGVPVVLCTIEDGEARGSGRSSGQINLFDAVSACRDDTTRFGGHAAAVGVTVPVDKLDTFRADLDAALAAYTPEEFQVVEDVDAEVRLDELSASDIDALDMLEPFGQGNPEPLFLVRNVFLDRARVVGAAGNHLAFDATDGIHRVGGIYFRCESPERFMDAPGAVDILFRARVDEWRGTRSPKLYVQGMRPTSCEEDFPPALDDREDGRSSFIDDLFERGDECLSADRYASIVRSPSFHTKVAGVTYEGRQAIIATVEPGSAARLVREPDNAFDSQAVAVVSSQGQIGYLNKELAARIAPVLDADPAAYVVRIDEVTGGDAESRASSCALPASALSAAPSSPVGSATLVDSSDGQMRSSADGMSREEADGRGVKTLFDAVQEHKRSLGVNLVVEKADEAAARADMQGADEEREKRAIRRRAWESRATGTTQAERRSSLGKALAGELLGAGHALHRAQEDALENLSEDSSTLVVMATGRGKSLIFHVHAARLALLDHKASVLVYPLRALIADQAFHLIDTFSAFGLNVSVLTGESGETDRARVFENLDAGAVDVLLTTPEFLSIHARRFVSCGRIGFLVVDEAHHVGMSKAGHRPAYATFATTRRQFPEATVLAATATADDEVASQIVRELGMERLVLDEAVRENLHLDDQRGVKGRATYLATIAASGEKCVAYVNSREQSIQLARQLRRNLPNRALSIGFYNAGLPREDRKTVERMFREGQLRTIVSTSAFGEGIDIPDIRDVVLYHLPFNRVEFNQMAGRAGRDGADATVHMLYGAGDAGINERILSSNAPSRADLVVLYRTLKSAQAASVVEGDIDIFDNEPYFRMTNADIARLCVRMDARCSLDESGVSTGIAIFKELGFVHAFGAAAARRLHVVENSGHVELSQSIRYMEGCEELEAFEEFRSWALSASPDELLAGFNRPILPRADLIERS